jgi:uncharacterized protein
MRYNVAQLLMEPTGSIRSYQLDETFEGPQSGLDRATGTVKILRTHQGVLVTARIETQVQTTCGRCLSEFQRLSSLTVEEESYPTVDPGTGQKLFPPDESEGAIHIDDRHMLDLSDVVRQYVLIENPIKPLCSDNCLGLCPECGANINEEKCKCDTVPADPRWGALSELLAEGRD